MDRDRALELALAREERGHKALALEPGTEVAALEPVKVLAVLAKAWVQGLA
jgi:hypothetical protein